MFSKIGYYAATAKCLVILFLSKEFGNGAFIPTGVIHDKRQWTAGNCNLVDGKVCGENLDYFCERETEICTPCGVYCAEEKTYYNERMCKEKCPAWWVAKHMIDYISTQTPAVDQTANSTSPSKTLEEIITSVVATKNALETSSLSDSSNTHYLVFVYLFIALLVFILALVLVYGIKRYNMYRKHKRNKITEKDKMTDSQQNSQSDSGIAVGDNQNDNDDNQEPDDDTTIVRQEETPLTIGGGYHGVPSSGPQTPPSSQTVNSCHNPLEISASETEPLAPKSEPNSSNAQLQNIAVAVPNTLQSARFTGKDVDGLFPVQTQESSV